MKTSKNTICALAGIALVAYAAPSSAITIVNGSFEDISGMVDSGDYANGTPNGWTFTGLEVQILKSPPFAPTGVDGERYVEMSGGTDWGVLSQVVTGLTVGHDYELSFLWGNRQSAFNMTVEMGGQSFATSGTGVANMTAQTLQFTAANTSETLALEWLTPNGVSGALDAFELIDLDAAQVEIPAPPNLAILGLGLAGLVAIRRKRIS